MVCAIEAQTGMPNKVAKISKIKPESNVLFRHPDWFAAQVWDVWDISGNKKTLRPALDAVRNFTQMPACLAASC